MLQFIVLGYIPGTSIQLNFIDIILIVTLCMAFSVAGSYFLELHLRQQLRALYLKRLLL